MVDDRLDAANVLSKRRPFELNRHDAWPSQFIEVCNRKVSDMFQLIIDANIVELSSDIVIDGKAQMQALVVYMVKDHMHRHYLQCTRHLVHLVVATEQPARHASESYQSLVVDQLSERMGDDHSGLVGTHAISCRLNSDRGTSQHRLDVFVFCRLGLHFFEGLGLNCLSFWLKIVRYRCLNNSLFHFWLFLWFLFYYFGDILSIWVSPAFKVGVKNRRTEF